VARVSKAAPAPGDQQEWRRGGEKARAARRRVASQVHEMIVESERTGSKSMVAARLREVSAAERSGDPAVLRAALMEVSAEAAAWAVHIDLGQVDGDRWHSNRVTAG
jgi:hypothetical protein